MNTTAITIKIDPQTKKEAQAIAEEFGLNLSSLVKSLLKNVIRTKRIEFDLEEPSDYLIEMLKESEEDRKAGRVSPGFTNADDATAWLNDPHARYENGKAKKE